MDIALRRAQEGMDGINAGRALFDKVESRCGLKSLFKMVHRDGL